MSIPLDNKTYLSYVGNRLIFEEEKNMKYTANPNKYDP